MLEIRLLIVERSKGLQKFLLQLFENFSFNTALIKTADSPQAALKIAQTFRIDLLLTEWFPEEDLNGIALFQAISATSPQCQFALTSDQVGPGQTQLAHEAGALFLLHTPCTAAELRTALGKALQVLGTRNPKIDARVNEQAVIAARHLNTLKAAATMPNFSEGERVRYKGNIETVKHVILSQGELMIQLGSVQKLVPATEVQKA